MTAVPSYDERVVSLIVFIFRFLGANLTGVLRDRREGSLDGPGSQRIGGFGVSDARL